MTDIVLSTDTTEQQLVLGQGTTFTLEAGVNLTVTGGVAARSFGADASALIFDVQGALTSDADGIGLYRGSGHTVTVGTLGSIAVSGIGLDALRTSSGSYTIEGSISSTGAEAVALGSDDWLINYGTLSTAASGDADLGAITQTGSNRVSNYGDVTADASAAITGDTGLDLRNGADIAGVGSVIDISADDGALIVISNSGTVSGGDIALSLDATTGGITVANTGTLTGAVSAIVLTGDGDHALKNRGTIEGDVVLAGGADSFDGRGGSVLGDVLAGAGNDNVWGGDLADSLFGEGGNDFIKGGLGNDNIFGGANNDRLFGGADDDMVRGGSGDDRLWGNSGDDLLEGGLGSDNLNGGAGNDVLNGDEGDDVLFGRFGDDTIDGGEGNDLVKLTGAQADYTFLLLESGAVQITDNTADRDGVDTVSNVEQVQFIGDDGALVDLSTLTAASVEVLG
ncbi:MAG: calcium-binding protein [Pseudomonadota bacterium]